MVNIKAVQVRYRLSWIRNICESYRLRATSDRLNLFRQIPIPHRKLVAAFDTHFANHGRDVILDSTGIDYELGRNFSRAQLFIQQLKHALFLRC